MFFRVTYFDHPIKGELEKPNAPVFYVLCFFVSFGLWNWIDFPLLSKLGDIGMGVYLIYLMATALLVLRCHRYELLIPHVVVILGLGVMRLTHAIQETREITVDNFSYRVPEYIDALQSGDAEEIEKIVTKYKSRKIPIAAILQFLPVTDKKSYLILVKHGVFNDSHEFERFLIHAYNKSSPEDQQILEAYAQEVVHMKEAMRRDFLFYLFYTPCDLGAEQRAFFLEKVSESGLKPSHFKMHPETYLLVDLVNEINILSPADLKERLDFLKVVLPQKEKFLPEAEIKSFMALLDHQVHELSTRSVK